MDLTISRLGNARIVSPLKKASDLAGRPYRFTPDDMRVVYDASVRPGEKKGPESEMSFEKAGARELIYFDPSKLKAGIVTCGGLCPGINNVIRSLVMVLHYNYGVKNIFGFRYGYEGLVAEAGHPAVDLSPEVVDGIHHDGGSFLGSSRGEQDPAVIVDTLERMGISLFFTIGGDGTLRGAQRIYDEIMNRGLKIAVICVPKTIDNDILLVERTFGFETAFSIAQQVIRAAHTEAVGYPNGIGLVRLMGRNSGYIAATAAVAEADVNCVLIPEVPFSMDGERGLISWLLKRLQRRSHAVIVVAEGAGQEVLGGGDRGKDASGNVKLGDIGLFLKKAIAEGLDKAGVKHNLKYIDPSYIIRSAPANPNDSMFCSNLAQNAIHAGVSGRTGMVVGLWHNMFTHVPIREAVSKTKVIDPDGDLWRTVLQSTGQPSRMA